MERDKRHEFFIVSASTLGLIVVALGAFSRKSKYEIHERDHWTCTRCDIVFPLEAGHKNHNKRHPDYDKPSNGNTFCPGCHLDDHIENAGKNGLSKKHNDWAIDQLRKRA